jgi:hypothetical protein
MTVVCVVILLPAAACGVKADGVLLPVTTATPTGDTPSPGSMPSAPTGTAPAEVVTSVVPDSAEPSAAGLGRPASWRGAASIQVTYYEYCDFSTMQRRYARSATYTLPVTFSVATPVRDRAGHADPNAFRFSFATDAQGAEGGFTTMSSSYGSRPEPSGREVLLVYWTVRHDQDTEALTGTLTDSHRAAGLAANLLFTSKPLDPCSDRLGAAPYSLSLNEGTTMTGTLGPDGGIVELSASTSDRSRDITVRAELSRGG